MKIKTNKETLVKAAGLIQNVISTKATLPILSNFLMETDKDKVRISATDLDICISFNLPVEVVEEGSITIPAKRFSDIVRDLPVEDINIKVNENNSISIKTQRCFFKLSGLSKDEFPKLPKILEEERIVISQSVLKTMLNLTAFAVSNDETRHVLNGILFSVNDKQIKMVSTDGRRLAVIDQELSVSSKFKRDVIVSLKAIKELLRNLKDTGDTTILFSENQISFKVNDVTIISRLIEGQFPSYEKVIPAETNNKIVVDKKRFLDATKRVSNLTSPNSLAIKISVFKDKLIFSKSTPDVGESKEEIDIDYKGVDIAIGFNPQYLIDVLRSVEDNVINFELTNEENRA